MKYSEVETGKLLKDSNKEVYYYMLINKDYKTFSYYVYTKSTLIFRNNIDSAVWSRLDYRWRDLQYAKSKRIFHLMIMKLFKEGLDHD